MPKAAIHIDAADAGSAGWLKGPALENLLAPGRPAAANNAESISQQSISEQSSVPLEERNCVKTLSSRAAPAELVTRPLWSFSNIADRDNAVQPISAS
ncbi:uncharacterized protein GIQ15_01320 [Arthroderma uncinatum]|uniref:uncharacterized protein n=1 Tax=Arthroderma uncinatum TaxID=74035 RepID=UPI00144A74FB|nr:uncharacterized protein GIQ15_01320 [Arthroderma uncinatum]KAF3491803.1 hypothetical protein GIQ15_01320 [Arthroderma uncinatum]